MKLTQFAMFIGGQNAGKSTLIRGISGCPNRSYQGFIEDVVRNRSVYVFASSPQESGISSNDYTAALEEAVLDPRCRAILLSVQPTNPSIRLSLEDCVNLARQVNQFNFHAFMITHPHEPSAPAASRDERRDIRDRLGGVGVDQITSIDNRVLLAENVVRCLAVLF